MILSLRTLIGTALVACISVPILYVRNALLRYRIARLEREVAAKVMANSAIIRTLHARAAKDHPIHRTLQ